MTEHILLLTLTREHPLEDLLNAAAICIVLLVCFSFFVASTKKKMNKTNVLFDRGVK